MPLVSCYGNVKIEDQSSSVNDGNIVSAIYSHHKKESDEPCTVFISQFSSKKVDLTESELVKSFGDKVDQNSSQDGPDVNFSFSPGKNKTLDNIKDNEYENKRPLVHKNCCDEQLDFRCENCGKKFPHYYNHIRVQERKHACAKLHKCGICFRVFSRKDGLKKHLIKIHKENNLVNVGVDVPVSKKPNLPLTDHSLSCDEPTIFISHISSEEINLAESDLTISFSEKVDQNSYQDDSSACSSFPPLKNKTSDDIKDNECQNKSTLVHENCCDEQLDFSCENCGKKFPHYYKHLRVQERKHACVKLHKCDICFKVFTRKHGLKRHLIKIHKENNLVNVGVGEPVSKKLNLPFTDHSLSCDNQREKVESIENKTEELFNKSGIDVSEISDGSHLSSLDHSLSGDNEEKKVKGVKKEYFEEKSADDLNDLASISNDRYLSSTDYSSSNTSQEEKIKKQIGDKINVTARSLNCQICNKEFSKSYSLKIHIRRHTGEKPFKCDVCSKAFYRNHEMQAHKKFHEINKNLTFSSNGQVSSIDPSNNGVENVRKNKCNFCDKSFLIKRDLTRHQDMHKRRSKNMFTCEVCDKKFDRKSTLACHTLTHTGEKPHSCEICKKQFTTLSSLKRHINTHSDELPHECSICLKRFRFQNYLKYHLMTHTGEKPYKCDACPRAFVKKTHLDEHYIIHSGEKPFECGICKKVFKYAFKLNNHILIMHHGVKQFNCKFCPKRFNTKLRAKDHMNLHTGMRPYVCSFTGCGKSFAYANGLSRHKIIHTGLQPYICNFCNKGFNQKTSLDRHYIIHTSEKPFSCDYCNQAYTQKYALLSHIRQKHS